MGKIPDSWRHELGWQLATAYILGSDEFAKAAHAAVDRAADDGRYDKTTRAEIVARAAASERRRRALRLAAEEADLEQAEAAAKARRAEFDRRAAELDA